MFVFSFLLWNLSLRKLGCLLVWTSSKLLFPRTILKDTNEICCFNTLSNIQREKTWFIKELWFKLNFCHCSWQCITLVEKNQHLSEMMSWNKSVEQNVINCILEIIWKSDPTSIATVASKLVNRECEGLCKRGTGSILQDTSYKGLFDFTWDDFRKEIQIQAPNTLKIISATVCNPTITPTPKKQLCILHTFASGVHGRFQEMSNLHYQIGLILAHGGCTVRVHILSLDYFVMFPVPWLKANKVLY